MSTYEVWTLIVGGIGAMMLFYIAVALDKTNKHLSNIANRVLDLEIELRKGR